jgi:hypothetical protein
MSIPAQELAPMSGELAVSNHMDHTKRMSISEPQCIRNHVERLTDEGFIVTSDVKVAWDEAHQLHPRNWPLRRKVYDTGIMFILELFTTIISNTGVSSPPLLDPTLTDRHVVAIRNRSS